MVSNQQFAVPFGIVDVFVFGRGGVVEISVEALVVEPVHPPQRGEFDIGDCPPWLLFRAVDQLGLVEAVDGFRQDVIGNRRPIRGLLAVPDSCIVVGFVFGWGYAPEPVHEPMVVVPVDPG